MYAFKKFIALFISAIIVLTLCSCGDNESGSATPESTIESPTEYSETQTSEITPEEEDQLLTWTYSVPLREIYVDVPDYKSLEAGYSQLFVDGDKKCVAVRYESEVDVTDIEEAFKINLNGFVNNLDLFYTANKALDYSGERVTINGTEFYKATGKIDFGLSDHHDGYLIGYGFVMDHTPCAVFGVVLDEQQPESEIAEVNTLVEAMVHTVRNRK